MKTYFRQRTYILTSALINCSQFTLVSYKLWKGGWEDLPCWRHDAQLMLYYSSQVTVWCSGVDQQQNCLYNSAFRSFFRARRVYFHQRVSPGKYTIHRRRRIHAKERHNKSKNNFISEPFVAVYRILLGHTYWNKIVCFCLANVYFR